MASKPNIIFLDFDGVICNPRACLAVGNDGMYAYLDPVALLLIKRLCDENNAKLVISSAWRIGRNLDFMQSILSAACSRLGEYVWNHQEDWRTVSTVFDNDESFVSNRGAEIKEWLDRHPTSYNRFVIIDDDSDMEPLMDSFVQTDAYDGIGFNNFLAAQRILRGEDEE